MMTENSNLIGSLRSASQAGTINAATRTLLLVFTCFSAASSGYLGWLYHLMGMAPAETTNVLALGFGYACQGLGILAAALLMKTRVSNMGRGALVGAVALHLACAILGITGGSLAATLAFGYAMNVLCGFIATFYLFGLSRCVRAERRGIVFGAGYACSTLATWLLSMIPAIATGALSNEALWCALFSIGAIAVATTAKGEMPAASSCADAGDSTGDRSASEASAAREAGAGGSAGIAWAPIALACVAVTLMSVVKSIGFDFPSADIGSTVNLEASRLLYAVGLVVAGIVIDRNRRYGAVLCMVALVVPFALLALSGEPIPSAVLWAIDYLFYGFFSVFRVVLFADMAAEQDQPALSGFGLMFGRFGDALGAFAVFLFGGSTIALVVIASALFAGTLLAFFRLFQQRYASQADSRDTRNDERRAIDAFVARYELSKRETDILRLALDKHTNPEMAEALVVSENTVKFHMRNILKKTGCKNRVELLAKFEEESAGGSANPIG